MNAVFGTPEFTSTGTPVWINGNGPPVVLVHGVLMDHKMWAAQVAALAPEFRVICLDMLGHGQAPDPPGDRELIDFVRQVDEVVEAFASDAPPVLGGFSMGGLIAQAYAIQHWSKLRAVMFLNAVYQRSAEQRAIVRERYELIARGDVEAVIAAARPRWFNARENQECAHAVEEILGWLREGSFSAKTKAHRVFASSDHLTAGRLTEVPIPALVMTGEGDTGSTPEMARRMAEDLPDARLHVLDAQQHMMPVLDAARVNQCLLRFLKSACGAAGASSA